MININLKQYLFLAFNYKKAAYYAISDRFFYKNKLAPFPRLINIFVTEKCNFNCPMCHLKKSRFKNINSETHGNLSFTELKPLFMESIKYTPSFQFVGGEPLLNPDIFKIIKFLHDNKMPTGLTTNGLLLEKNAEKIIDSGLDFLTISLDGPDEGTQYHRGYVKNSFTIILRGIKKIASLKKNKQFPNIRVATVVSKNNLDNFEKVLNIAEEAMANQWSISHHFYYYDKVKEDQDNFNKNFNLGKEIWGYYNGDKKELFGDCEINKIKERYDKIRLKIKAKENKIRISIQKDVDIEKYYKGFSPAAGSKCSSPYYQIFIRGNGDVEMCQGYILGNIKKEKLKNIWHNEKSQHFREVLEIGLTPACFRCCALGIKL